MLQLGAMLAETGIPPFAAGLAVLLTGLALFDPVAQIVGGHGVSFNPATSACFAAAGKGSWGYHLLRMVCTSHHAPNRPSVRCIRRIRITELA